MIMINNNNNKKKGLLIWLVQQNGNALHSCHQAVWYLGYFCCALVMLCCIMLLYITYTQLRTLLSTRFTWAWNWLRITLPAGSRLLSVATATNTWSAYVITDTAMLRPDCAGSKEYTLLSGQPPTSTAADGPTTELNCRLACTITTTVKAYFIICRIHTLYTLYAMYTPCTPTISYRVF